jgi:hypothetical protein
VLPKPEVIAIVAQTVFALCDGELNEVTATRALPSEAAYLERIELKTASLYAACCQGAALLADADPEHVAALGAYGTSLGLAFQITDDVLDVAGDETDFGKAVGRDLVEGMPTLPMIYAVDETRDARLGARIVAPGKSPGELRDLLRMIRESGGIERARARALSFHDDAVAADDGGPASGTGRHPGRDGVDLGLLEARVLPVRSQAAFSCGQGQPAAAAAVAVRPNPIRLRPCFRRRQANAGGVDGNLRLRKPLRACFVGRCPGPIATRMKT